jgi:hypothetical protein
MRPMATISSFSSSTPFSPLLVLELSSGEKVT